MAAASASNISTLGSKCKKDLGRNLKTSDSSVPADPHALASELTNLDQRSWLEAMGDPQPVSELESLTSAGNIDIDGTSWPLWQGVHRSHSDLSADLESQLAGILGMPKKSLWPLGVSPFHDVTLDGYLAWKVDTAHRVTLVIYAVAGRSSCRPMTGRALYVLRPLQ